MGKLNPPYTVNPSVQPEIFGRPTAFARQADAAGIFHLSHTFRPALNNGAFPPHDPLRPNHLRAAVMIWCRLLNLNASAGVVDAARADGSAGIIMNC
jgi:hypothetical protein